MNIARFLQKSLQGSIVAALIVAGVQIVTQEVASACAGDLQGGVATGICNGEGNGNTAGGGDADPDWFVVSNSGIACMYDPDDPDTVNGNEIPSYFGTIQNYATGEQKYQCVAQNPGTIGTGLVGQVKKELKAPTPEADFKDAFLVGAPIHFTAPALKNYTVNVPNFPGVKLIITTTDVSWDFGDGTTSKDLEPVHVYESISPNKQKNDQHTVKVAMNATWQVNMMDPTTGTTADLGTFTDAGELDRSIVQVWSKQTEPNS